MTAALRLPLSALPPGPVTSPPSLLSRGTATIAAAYRASLHCLTVFMKIPELELELSSGTLGGLVTTVEGLISKIGESLEKVHGFTFGDSMDNAKRSKWKEFRAKIEQLKRLEEPRCSDQITNSFVALVTDEMKEDTQRHRGKARAKKEVSAPNDGEDAVKGNHNQLVLPHNGEECKIV